VALFLTTIAILAVAPMFLHAAHANDASADLGTVGVLALDRAEQLRRASFRGLEAGGSLSQNLAGYFDELASGYTVRWTIEDLGSPSRTKRIIVLAAARGQHAGPRRQVEMTFLRGL